VLDKLTVTEFAQRLGGRFRVHMGTEPPLEFELTEANALGRQTAESGSRQPFSLICRGPRQPVLRQKTYDLEHVETCGNEYAEHFPGAHRTRRSWHAI
jgi:hypothetical protein